MPPPVWGRGRRAVLGAAAALIAADVPAHGGLSMDEDSCKLVVGRYLMHFTGYQPDSVRGPKEFCEDIPETGRTVVVLDYLHDDLRDLPTEVRVIRDTGREDDVAGATVLHVPPKVYPTGSLSFEMNFPESGKFVGLVTVGDKQKFVSRFPFSVGGGASSWWHMAVPAVIAVVGGVALYRFAVRRRSQPVRQE